MQVSVSFVHIVAFIPCAKLMCFILYVVCNNRGDGPIMAHFWEHMMEEDGTPTR